jgi:hypothetical protein
VNLTYVADAARGASTALIQSSRKLPALRQPCVHAQRHAQKKLEIVQLWRCASCKRTFTPGPQAIRNKTYPLRTVIDALSTYSIGYSLEDTAARVKSKSGRHIGASTVAGWLAQHKDLMSYLRLRDKGRHLFPPEQTIRSIKLYHRQIYRYAFHRPKLEFLRHGELDDIRDREALGAMLAEVAGKQASETHLTATGAKKKGIIRMALDGNGRAKKDNWKPSGWRSRKRATPSAR